MKKLFGFALALLLALALCCAASAENQYYFIDAPLEITDGGIYTAVIHAGTDGWEWSISENKDVTSWLVKADGTPAFTATEGVAKAHLVYGPFEGVEGDVATTLEVAIDMSKVGGFTENGAFDLYFQPIGKDAIWACGDNHGQYVDCMEKLGTIHVPSVQIDGLITGNSGEALSNDTVGLVLDMDGFDSAKLDAGALAFEILEGDGYYPENFAVEASLADTWEGNRCDVTVSSLTGAFGMQGGDGNGHYSLRIAMQGLNYDGLPISTPIIRTDIYAFGRTFLSDHGSLIWFAEPEWASKDEKPVLCDVYPDTFEVTWPVGMDASALTAEDVGITLVNDYGDELALVPGTDFTVEASSYETKIVTTYIYWPTAPVFSGLKVDISAEHLTRDAQMYADTPSFSHTFDIASVYAYNEMGGGPSGTQGWTFYGFANLADASQVFYPATYTLTTTEADGKVWFYAENESGEGVLVDNEADAIAFNCDVECDVKLVGQQVQYTRVSGTEVKSVDGAQIEFEKRYVKCEVLTRKIEDLDENLELLPGYALGKSWEDHLKWPWQSFIGIGFMGGSK